MTENETKEMVNQLAEKIHEHIGMDSDDFDGLMNLKIALEDTIAEYPEGTSPLLDYMKQAAAGNEEMLEKVENAIAQKFNELQEEDMADNLDLDWE